MKKIVLSEGIKGGQIIIVILLSLWMIGCIVSGLLGKTFTNSLLMILFCLITLGSFLYWHAKRFFDITITENDIIYGNLFFKKRKIPISEFVKIIPLDESIFAGVPYYYSLIVKSRIKLWFGYRGERFQSRATKATQLNQEIMEMIGRK